MHKNPTVWLVLIALATASTASAATDVPRFPKNMRYELAREALVASGWQPGASPGARDCGRPDMCNADQPEVVACQETGLRQCTAVWRKGETVIDVTTWGMSPPMVERVQCRAGCR